MKKTMNALKVPTAAIAVNKSRLKVYDKKSDIPVYYLTKGQEPPNYFHLGLYNSI